MTVLLRIAKLYAFDAGVWLLVSLIVVGLGRLVGRERTAVRRIEADVLPRAESRSAAFATLTQSFGALALVQASIVTFLPANREPAAPASIGLVLLEVLGSMVAFDFLFYASHRLLHVPAIWRIHALHHRFRFVNVWVRNADSFAQVPLVALFTLPLQLVPIHLPAKVAFFLLTTTMSAVQHGGYEWFPRSKLIARLFVTPTHHSMHHTEHDCNFAFFFTLWDDVFGTLHPDYRRRFLGSGEPSSTGRTSA